MTPVTAQDPQAVALYDTMMRVINPDLTSDQLQETMKRKNNETQEDYDGRMQEYAAAFFTMDQAMAELQTDFDMQAFLEKADVQAEKSSIASREDSEAINNIEDQLSSSDQ